MWHYKRWDLLLSSPFLIDVHQAIDRIDRTDSICWGYSRIIGEDQRRFVLSIRNSQGKEELSRVGLQADDIFDCKGLRCIYVQSIWTFA